MIRVLIVDDSAIVRRILSEELDKFDDISVVGTAVDPFMARDMIIKLDPDVLTLDIEMPKMDGLSFLKRLMKYHPMPVIIVSSVAPRNSQLAIEALSLGAIDVIPKPGSGYSIPDMLRLKDTVKVAMRAKLTGTILPKKRNLHPATMMSFKETQKRVIAIGGSTGGPKAIETILREMPLYAPAIVIVQHMPKGFTRSFAQRLDSISAMHVKEAENNDELLLGHVFIAPGDKHLFLKKRGGKYCLVVKDGPLVHHQRPSVDVMFHSVAEVVGHNAIGVLLTGMGADGAQGLLQLKKRGAKTLAQDENTSVVFGMPKQAIKLGAADEVVPIHKMANAIIQLLDSSQPSPKLISLR